MNLPSEGDPNDTMDIKFELNHQSERMLEQISNACDDLTLGHEDTPLPGSDTRACDTILYPGRLPLLVSLILDTDSFQVWNPIMGKRANNPMPDCCQCAVSCAAKNLPKCSVYPGLV